MSNDDETTTISTAGMMTPTVRPHSLKTSARKTDIWKTTACSSLGQQLQEPTITILVEVKDRKGYIRRNVQVNMRRSMTFGELVSLLKARFDQSKGLSLRKDIPQRNSMGPSECVLIFDSDTPAWVWL